MSKQDGGPAFPRRLTYSEMVGDTEFHPGMSLRDHFAGQALVGLLAHNCDESSREWKGIDGATSRAYAYADAMLREREK